MESRGMSFPHNTVSFPMTKLYPLCNNGWSVMDTDSIWDVTSMDFSPILFLPLCLFPSQILPEWCLVVSNGDYLFILAHHFLVEDTSLLYPSFCLVYLLFVHKCID